MLMMRLASNDRFGKGWAIDAVAEHLIFAAIVTLWGTVDIDVEVDVGRVVSDRIQCNGAVKLVPGGVVCTGGLASEGVQVIWYC